MNKLMKISAFIVILAVITMITGTVSAKTADDNVDWDHIQYGSPDMGDNVSGIPCFIDDNGYVVPTHFLTKAQYKAMWSKIAKWQAAQHTTRLPNYVDISYMKVGVNKVTKSQFLDMKKRWDAYKKSHKGKEPNIIGIEMPIGVISW